MFALNPTGDADETTFHNQSNNDINYLQGDLKSISYEDVAVKQEPTDEKDTIREQNSELKALYKDHIKKEEMVIGPEMLQLCDGNQHVSIREGDRKQSETIKSRKKTKYICNICSKEFIRSCHLAAHIKLHSGENLYSCSTCNKKFSRKDYLTSHMRSHRSEKPYVCSTCNKKFSTKGHLKSHIKSNKDNKRYVCATCNKVCIRRYTLIVHIRLHSDISPYVCSTCDKKFSQKSALTVHMRLHIDDKPYVCDTCYKKFSQLFSLRRHIRLHTGYACSKCNDNFMTKTSLIDHQILGCAYEVVEKKQFLCPRVYPPSKRKVLKLDTEPSNQ